MKTLFQMQILLKKLYIYPQNHKIVACFDILGGINEERP
jgi:hypothetical protein